MAIKTKTDLKTFFENGDEPDAQAFIDLIDTLVAINSAGGGYIGELDTPFRVQGGTYRTTQDSEGFKITDGTGQPTANITKDGLKFLRMIGTVTYATVELPAWNMDIDQFITIDLSDYLTRDNIMSVSYKIISDSGNVYMEHKDVSISLLTMATNGVITINREVGGIFDDSEFSSTAESRGRLIIGYNKLA